MNAQELLNFLCQENIGLEVWDSACEGCRLYSFQCQYDDKRRFEWYHESLTVNVWTIDGENIDCFTMNDATLSDVLRGIKEYRTDKEA